jgi:thiosulfate/3-mercaptopyruvate sulfurtransferase
MRRRQFVNAIAVPFFTSPVFAEQPDPWSAAELVKPEAFAKELRADPSKFAILYVGFPILYKGAHITNALLAGPCSKPEGLQRFRRLVAAIPGNKDTLLYCGCCPLDRCPNIRPAYITARDMKVARLRVLHLPTNLHTDWEMKGYPTQKSL